MVEVNGKVKVAERMHPGSGPVYVRFTSLGDWHIVHSFSGGVVWVLCGKVQSLERGGMFHASPEKRLCPRCLEAWGRMRHGGQAKQEVEGEGIEQDQD